MFKLRNIKTLRIETNINIPIKNLGMISALQILQLSSSNHSTHKQGKMIGIKFIPLAIIHSMWPQTSQGLWTKMSNLLFIKTLKPLNHWVTLLISKSTHNNNRHLEILHLNILKRKMPCYSKVSEKNLQSYKKVKMTLRTKFLPMISRRQLLHPLSILFSTILNIESKSRIKFHNISLLIIITHNTNQNNYHSTMISQIYIIMIIIIIASLRGIWHLYLSDYNFILV